MINLKASFLCLYFLFVSSIANAYDLTILKVSGYSKPFVLISSGALPMESLHRIHLHLHGWTQDPINGKPFRQGFDFSWKDTNVTPSEGDLRRFVEAYSIQKTVEGFPDRAVLIPIARGHCDQYNELTADFEGILSKVFESVGMNSDQLVIDSASAHSGGGEVLSKLLHSSSNLQKTGKVFMIDAVYHDATRDRLKLWLGNRIEGSARTLEMPVIPNQSPQKYGAEILGSIQAAEKKLDFLWADSRFVGAEKIAANGNTFLLYRESKTMKLDHWTIVKNHFEMSLNPEIKRKPSSKKSSH